jgi:hypothetical protein
MIQWARRRFDTLGQHRKDMFWYCIRVCSLVLMCIIIAIVFVGLYSGYSYLLSQTIFKDLFVGLPTVCDIRCYFTLIIVSGVFNIIFSFFHFLRYV